MATKSLKKRSSDSDLVPYTGKNIDGYPSLFKPLIPDGTHFKMDGKGNVTALLTVAPGGMKVAWDSCGSCHNHVKQCKCVRGIAAPRSIEYIVDSSRAVLAGEEWSFQHPNYRGSLREALKAARGPASLTGLRAPLTAPKTATGTRQPQAPASPAQDSTGAPKRLLRKPTAAPAPLAPMPDEATDMKRLNAAAESASDDLMKSMTKRLLRKPDATPVAKPVMRKTLKRRES